MLQASAANPKPSTLNYLLGVRRETHHHVAGVSSDDGKALADGSVFCSVDREDVRAVLDVLVEDHVAEVVVLLGSTWQGHTALLED